MSSEQTHNGCLKCAFKWKALEDLNETYTCDEVNASLQRSQPYLVAKI